MDENDKKTNFNCNKSSVKDKGEDENVSECVIKPEPSVVAPSSTTLLQNSEENQSSHLKEKTQIEKELRNKMKLSGAARKRYRRLMEAGNITSAEARELCKKPWEFMSIEKPNALQSQTTKHPTSKQDVSMKAPKTVFMDKVHSTLMSTNDKSFTTTSRVLIESSEKSKPYLKKSSDKFSYRRRANLKSTSRENFESSRAHYVERSTNRTISGETSRNTYRDDTRPHQRSVYKRDSGRPYDDENYDSTFITTMSKDNRSFRDYSENGSDNHSSCSKNSFKDEARVSRKRSFERGSIKSSSGDEYLNTKSRQGKSYSAETNHGSYSLKRYFREEEEESRRRSLDRYSNTSSFRDEQLSVRSNYRQDRSPPRELNYDRISNSCFRRTLGEEEASREHLNYSSAGHNTTERDSQYSSSGYYGTATRTSENESPRRSMGRISNEESYRNVGVLQSHYDTHNNSSPEHYTQSRIISKENLGQLSTSHLEHFSNYPSPVEYYTTSRNLREDEDSSRLSAYAMSSNYRLSDKCSTTSRSTFVENTGMARLPYAEKVSNVSEEYHTTSPICLSAAADSSNKSDMDRGASKGFSDHYYTNSRNTVEENLDTAKASETNRSYCRNTSYEDINLSREKHGNINESETISREDVSTRVAIKDECLMNEDRIKMLHKALISRVQTCPDSAACKQFLGFSHKPGWAVVTCGNRQSLNWILREVPKLKPWKDAHLSVVSESETALPHTAKTFIPEGEARTVEDAMELITSQNEGLNVGVWKVLHSKKAKCGLVVTFLIDQVSATAIRQKQYKVALGFSQVTFKIRGDNNFTSYKKNIISASSNSNLHKHSQDTRDRSKDNSPDHPMPGDMLTEIYRASRMITSAQNRRKGYYVGKHDKFHGRTRGMPRSRR